MKDILHHHKIYNYHKLYKLLLICIENIAINENSYAFKPLRNRLETIPQKTMEALQAYPWPGNVRELEHVIERAIILSQGPQLALGHWLAPPETVPGAAGLPTLVELERDHILKVLERTDWRVSGARGAARILGLKRTTLDLRKQLADFERSIEPMRDAASIG